MGSEDKTEPGRRQLGPGLRELELVEQMALSIGSQAGHMLDLVEAARRGQAEGFGAAVAAHLREAGNELLAAARAYEGKAARRPLM